MNINIATSYLPVSADIRRNLAYIVRHMRDARSRGADVVHFPEACLSGYAGVDFDSYEGFDWNLLEASAERVLEEARAWAMGGARYDVPAFRQKQAPQQPLYHQRLGKDRQSLRQDVLRRSGIGKLRRPGALQLGELLLHVRAQWHSLRRLDLPRLPLSVRRSDSPNRPRAITLGAGQAQTLDCELIDPSS